LVFNQEAPNSNFFPETLALFGEKIERQLNRLLFAHNDLFSCNFIRFAFGEVLFEDKFSV